MKEYNMDNMFVVEISEKADFSVPLYVNDHSQYKAKSMSADCSTALRFTKSKAQEVANDLNEQGFSAKVKTEREMYEQPKEFENDMNKKLKATVFLNGMYRAKKIQSLAYKFENVNKFIGTSRPDFIDEAINDNKLILEGDQLYIVEEDKRYKYHVKEGNIILVTPQSRILSTMPEQVFLELYSFDDVTPEPKQEFIVGEIYTFEAGLVLHKVIFKVIKDLGDDQYRVLEYDTLHDKISERDEYLCGNSLAATRSRLADDTDRKDFTNKVLSA